MGNKFTKKYEGFSEEPYLDSNGNPTVGAGINMNSPEVPELMKSAGLDYDSVLSGKQKVSEQKSNFMHDRQVDEKYKMWQDLKSKEFPLFQEDEGKISAVNSLTMNSPALLGPNIQKLMNENDTPGVIKEILLNSNKKDNPGLQKRRLGEAKEYAGPDFQNIVDNLSDNEKYEIRDIVMNIKNMNERNKVMAEYPFLNKIIKPRFGKIPVE